MDCLEDLSNEVLRLRRALRTAAIGIWDWDLRTGAFAYSAEARGILGLDPDVEVTLDLLRAVTYPDDLPLTSAQAQTAINSCEPSRQHYEYRIIRADTREVRWVRAEAEPIFEDQDGRAKAVRYVGTLEDIHDRKATELALADAERRQRLAIDAARMALWEYDIASETIIGSPELNRLFGFGAEEERSLQDFVACYLPGERERVRQAGREALEAGRTHFEVEYRVRRADGACRWLLLRAEVLQRPDGTYDRVLGVVMDIDERKQAAERQHLLVRELNHRVKNSLSVVQAIAGQTFRKNVPSDKALEIFRGRLSALASANEIVMEGDRLEASLASLVHRVTAPYRDHGQDPFLIDCGDVRIPPTLNAPLALALHELSTNAAKYGALTAPGGRVTITCGSVGDALSLAWKETGGPTVRQGGPDGFGTKLLRAILSREFISLDLVFEPDGVRCDIRMPRG
ncbi:MAG: sensor histidine kinase [Pararhizobium sp.]